MVEKLVKEGKFVLGPWYVLPDEFLVSGESLVRNLRMGREKTRAALPRLAAIVNLESQPAGEVKALKGGKAAFSLGPKQILTVCFA